MSATSSPRSRLRAATKKPIQTPSVTSGESAETLCLRVLGYIDEIFRGEKDGKAGSVMQWGKIETLEALKNLIEGTHSHDGLNKAVLAKIKAIFDEPSNQVKNVFLTKLIAEKGKYESAIPRLQNVALAERQIQSLWRKIIKKYQKIKQERPRGQLIQTEKDDIGELERQRVGVENFLTEETKKASETEKGFLIAQKLLRYKKQLQKSGFVITPSRQKLINRITEEVMLGKKVFLVGSTGTGKTDMALLVANTLTGGYELIPWHEGIKQRDILGHPTVATDEQGKIQAGISEGPLERGMKKGKIVVHEEYTTGPNATGLSTKVFQNAKVEDTVQMNGRTFVVKAGFGEIFSGNLADEKTSERTDMDPALLRMLTGIGVDFMPPAELTDIILSGIITDSGVLPLSPSEVGIIQKLSQVSHMMHLFHDREFATIEANTTGHSALSALQAASGGKFSQATLDKVFLDPGTLLSWFKGLELTGARGGDLRSHITEQIERFLTDPKNKNKPAEKKLIQAIFAFYGLFDNKTGKVTLGGEKEKEAGTEAEVNKPEGEANKEAKEGVPTQKEQPFLLPSELKSVFPEEPKRGEQGLLGADGNQDSPPEYPPNGPKWDYDEAYEKALAACESNEAHKATIKWLDLDTDPKYTSDPAWRTKVLAMFPDASKYNNRIPVLEFAPGKRLPLIPAFAPDEGEIVKEATLPDGSSNPAYLIQKYVRNHENPDHGHHQTYATYDFWCERIGISHMPTKEDFDTLVARYPYPVFAKILGMNYSTAPATRNSKWCSPKDGFQTNSAGSCAVSSSLVLSIVQVLYSLATIGGVRWVDRHNGCPVLPLL